MNKHIQVRFVVRSIRSASLGLLAGMALLVGFAATCQGAKVPRAVLKEYFQTGDKPTAAQFEALIDSVLNLNDDRHLLGLRAYDPGRPELGADMLNAGALLDFSAPFGPAAGLSDEWLGHTGFLGLTFTNGSSGDVQLGYLQIAAGGPADPYPMFIEYFVYDDLGGTSLSITSVPEPSTLVLGSLALLAVGGFAMRRQRAARILSRGASR